MSKYNKITLGLGIIDMNTTMYLLAPSQKSHFREMLSKDK